LWTSGKRGIKVALDMYNLMGKKCPFSKMIFSSEIQFDPLDPFWTDLIQSHQNINKVKNLLIYFKDYYIRNPILSSLNNFDPF
jgi:hypothetical protein